MFGASTRGTAQLTTDRAIRKACDIRLHRSFLLPPNRDIGRNTSIRVSYADCGYKCDAGEEPEDYGTVLWIPGQFGGRWVAFGLDEVARKHHKRLLIVDRPGIGGTPSVPLAQRVQTWIDTVPAFLQHVNAGDIHLASHSAGTIFLLNTLLHHRQLLHPTCLSVYLFGPWVHPSDSGRWTMTAVSYLPDFLVANFHTYAKFAHDNLAPMFAASGVTVTKAKTASLSSIGAITGPSVPTVITADAANKKEAQEEEELWHQTAEALATKFVFAENIEGGGAEASLCMKKGAIHWGFDTIEEAINRIAAAERNAMGENQRPRLHFKAFFASDDEMIGAGGQKYIEDSFNKAAAKGGITFEGQVLPDSDHNEVMAPKRGAVGEVFRNMGKPPRSQRNSDIA